MAGLLSSMFGGGQGGQGGLLSDPMVRLQMGAAMMGGKTLGEQLGNGFQVAGMAGMDRRTKLEEQKRQNQTIEFLRRNSPELAQAVEAGALDPVSAYKMHMESQKPKGPNYMEVGGQLFDPATQQWIAPPPIPGAHPKKALQPIYMDDGKGGIVVGQLDESGRLDPVQTPEGYKPLSPYDKAFQGAQGREVGQYQGSHQATAQQDLQSADMALGIVDQIKANSYLDRGTGASSMLNSIPGTGGYDFQNLVDQTKSGAFLSAIQQMRGLGALSDAEGKAATAAIARLDTATSKEAFLKALDDYQIIIEQGKARAQSYMPNGGAQGGVAPQSAFGDPSIDALVQKYGG